MKVLITGITGLLGSYLAREFLDIAEIHGLKRRDSDPRLVKDIFDAIHWHEGDILDYESFAEAIEGMDLVIHAAGFVSFDPSKETMLLKINVEGTQNVVNALLDKGIKQLIHISSVSALGRNPAISIMDENTKWSANPLNTPYSVSKYLGELEVWRAAQEGLEVMIFNPSILLGKLSDNRSSTGIYNYVLDENKYYPKGNINYLDIRDASGLIKLLFLKGDWNERFILNKESIPYRVFFETTAKHLKKNAPYKMVPDSLIRIAVWLVRIKSAFQKSKSPLTVQTAKLAQQKIHFNNQKVQAILGFKYRSLAETLEWAVKK